MIKRLVLQEMSRARKAHKQIKINSKSTQAEQEPGHEIVVIVKEHTEHSHMIVVIGFPTGVCVVPYNH